MNSLRTFSFGDALRSAREKAGLSLAAVNKRTHIQLEYLEALERNDFAKLPPAPFVRGFIRLLSEVYEADATMLLSVLRRDFAESAEGGLIARELVAGSARGRSRQVWSPVTFTTLAAATLVGVLFIYILSQWYQLQKPPFLRVDTPNDRDFVSSQFDVKGATVTDATVQVDDQPVAIQPDGTFTTQVYLPREGIHFITVEAKDRRGKTAVVQRAVHVRF